MQNKTLLVDCDGVLYPSEALTLKDFVEAMKETYRQDVKLDGTTQARISEETIAQNKLGLFNYIKAVCDYTGYGFENFCRKMFDRIDYSNITRDDGLYQNIKNVAQNQPVMILTNNHILHLDKVLQQRFGKSVFDFEADGIQCYDITLSEKNGVFYPKHDPQGLAFISKRIGVPVESCILVDDMPRNITAARNIGMSAVLISDKFTLKQYLTQIAPQNISREKENERR